MNRYYDNDVCNRLCEAAIAAGNNQIELRLDGLGVVVHAKDIKYRISYIDISDAKVNVILLKINDILRKSGRFNSSTRHQMPNDA